jgi:hypothetical protein
VLSQSHFHFDPHVGYSNLYSGTVIVNGEYMFIIDCTAVTMLAKLCIPTDSNSRYYNYIA